MHIYAHPVRTHAPCKSQISVPSSDQGPRRALLRAASPGTPAAVVASTSPLQHRADAPIAVASVATSGIFSHRTSAGDADCEILYRTDEI
jgi:hypothetical protein